MATLKNVAYVPTFHTSIDSYHCVEEIGGKWGTSSKQLMLNGEVFGKVFKIHRQHVMEYTPVTPSTSAFPMSSTAPRRPVPATTDIWHCRLGHLHAEAIAKLPAAAEGVKITSSTLAPCETCVLTNAKQIVSRRPTERATVVFGRVHLDLIQLD
jgi:hypothetical protein